MLTCVITSPLWLLLLLLHVSVSRAGSLFMRGSERGPREGEVRLVGGRLLSEGRVEIYHDGRWGTVCDDGWALEEAQVVCRQLQFPAAKAAISGGTYGEGSGSIWLDDMNCKGTEKTLSSCSFKGWALSDCSHKEDAGVVCETGTNTSSDATVHFLDHSLGLSEELGQLFDSGDGCDLDVLVRSPTGNRLEDGSSEVEEVNICTHRLVLSLHPQLNATLKSGNLTIEVSQSCKTHVTSFIRYLYTRQTEVTISSARCLHQLASELHLSQLMQDTGRLFTVLLPEDSTFHTQVSLYQYSVETGDLQLQENCLQYLSWNCEALTSSPAWKELPTDVLLALLSRSDLVLPDEAFLLQALESWILERADSISTESQAALLGHIRFPMIPVEKLYDLPFTSQLYKNHEKLYSGGLLRGFELNVLLLGTLKKHAGFNIDMFQYQSRIYTAEPWSLTINTTNQAMSIQPGSPITPWPFMQQVMPNYGRRGYGYHGYQYIPATTPTPNQGSLNSRSRSFSTPVHNSMVFQKSSVSWAANVFVSQRECSNNGLNCASFPAARLSAQSSLSEYQSSIRFSNRLLILCEGRYVSHVQDFKEDLALVPASNSSQSLTYPCRDDKYGYRFVVRPGYLTE